MNSTRTVSLLYFFLFLALACQGRFLSLFYRDLGLQKDEIGFVISLGTMVGMAGTPAWAMIVDLTSFSKRSVLILSTMVACVAVGLYLVPMAIDLPSIFLWTLFAKALYSFFFAPVNTILDTIAVHQLENPKRDFGRCRLWGAASWGLCNAFILGPFLDTVGSWIMCPGFFIASLLNISIVFGLMPREEPESPQAKSRKDRASYANFEDETEDSVSKGRDAAQTPKSALQAGQEQRQTPASPSSKVLSSAAGTVWAIFWAERYQSLLFFVALYCLGIGTTLVEGLVFLFWTEELGASNFLCGLSVLVTVSLEIPLFHFSERILNSFDHHTLIVMGGLSYAFRVACYTVFVDPWWVLAVEPLHGVTFAFVTLGSVHYAATLAPPGLETSTQSLAATVKSLGSITGTFVGGIIMEHYGSVVLYRGAAALVMVAVTIYALVSHWHSRAPPPSDPNFHVGRPAPPPEVSDAAGKP